MHLFADIAHGETTLADVLFLIAAVVFFISFIIKVLKNPPALDDVLIPAGLCLVSIAWLVL